jgi:aminopeptidase
LVLGVFSGGKLTPEAERVNELLGGKLKDKLESSKNKGKEGEVILVPANNPQLPPLIAMVGMGISHEAKSKGSQKEASRRAAHIGCSFLKGLSNTKKIAIESFCDAQAVAEGTFLGLHKYKKEKDETPVTVQHFTTEAAAVASAQVQAWELGSKLAEVQNFTRVLAETPSNLMTPTIFVNRAKEKLAAFDRIKIEAREKDWIEEQKMGCLIGVSKGSSEPPRFLEIHYKGADNNEPPLALVGKGITFDSGGISIKPSENMGLMRGDMAGAASVVGTILGLASLKIPRNVVALMPLCENMPSGTATKPGDVLVSMSGKTIEVDNTDAEGRLVLADALHYSHSFNPHTIIDIATLTGAMSRALGDQITGVFTPNEGVWQAMRKAGDITGQFMWRMPLARQYKYHLKSTLADLKNSTPGPGAITAALFLQNFVENKEHWMHMDIAGTNHRKAPAHKGDYQAGGMTGTPVRALIEFIQSWSPPKEQEQPTEKDADLTL